MRPDWLVALAKAATSYLNSEPDRKYYWISSYYFTDDLLLSEKERRSSINGRGGSGILQLERADDLWLGKRDIVLGKNVLGY